MSVSVCGGAVAIGGRQRAGRRPLTADRPLVSCVTIFYNAERFLGDAIRSVVDQAGFSDWELILVDDGSTDGSTRIAQEAVATDPRRIRYVEHPGHANLGMSAARNAGVSVARGEYVAFLDADDVWLPSALAHRMRVAAAHPSADVFYGGTWRWCSWTGDPADLARDIVMALPAGPRLSTIEPPAVFRSMYGQPRGWKLPGMCSVLIRKRAFMEIGGMEPSFRALHEDQVLYVKSSLHLRVVLDPRALALYRQHPDSTCFVAISDHTWTPDAPSIREAHFLSWMEEYVAQHADGSSLEWDVVRRNVERQQPSVPDPSGAKLAPRELLRRVAPPGASRLVRRVRGRVRERWEAPQRRSVLGEWTAQHLSSLTSSGRAVLVVEPSGGARERWTAFVPPETFPSASSFVAEPLHLVPARSRFDLIVVPVEAAAELGSRALLTALARILTPRGTAVVFAPGRALPSSVLAARGRVDTADLARLAGEAFPHATTAVEAFGNATTAAAVEAGSASRDVTGVAIDRHDPEFPVLVTLTVTPPVRSAPADEGRGADQMMIVESGRVD